MASIPYMPFYISDYLSDAAHLSTIEHGAYLLLIMTYWQTGKPLLDNDRNLANICRLSLSAFTKMKINIKNFFLLEDGFLIHKRLEKELEKFRRKSDSARVSGAKGGSSRVTEVSSKRLANAKQTLSYTDTDTNKDKIKEKKLKEKKEKQEAMPLVDQDRPGGVLSCQQSHPVQSVEPVDPSAQAPPVAVVLMIEKVFQHWRDVMSHPRAVLDRKRRSVIEKSLKLYSPNDLFVAISGCAKTPFNMGENDRNTRFDSIELILRDSDHIENFIRNFYNPPPPTLSRGKMQEVENQAEISSWATKKLTIDAETKIRRIDNGSH